MLTGIFEAAPAAVAALDVGGTSMKGVIVGADGRWMAGRRWVTPREQGPEAAVAAVLRAVDDLLASAGGRVGAVGLVVPGLVDERRGVAVFSENIGWSDVPFRDLVAARTGLPVAFGHDVRSGGIAEHSLGAARDVGDVLVMPIGTGISGAMFIEGRLVENEYAGEIGHIRVGGNEPCACGASGCLEAIASGASIAQRYSRATGTPVPGAAQVVAAMQGGDDAARRVWDEAITALADALTTYISLLAPELIVVGGGLSRAGAVLLDPLHDQLRQRLVWQTTPRLAVAALGDDASCAGAALLARGLLPAAALDNRNPHTVVLEETEH
jgi:glucokinase